ncbi:hypothetical protein HMPREF1210_01147 [Paenisporosarcina sp. HGH0030]|uniref:hypothetical protein n=1 Tax=Paenisporosarcina sp. HGH0030 TaxID=1078085 RepID=UPI00034E47D2|nr:hypothetical protein [Paenisporosarcina sp. HGH0030]EPD52767.1 hypothetical protein HMPREF1210_01147 [Paenisporosarcina sp. HGH0030]
MDKTEKYLKSIDNSLKDILKELKHQRLTSTTTHVTVDAKKVHDIGKVIKQFDKTITSGFL